jgi:hypothetical protein
VSLADALPRIASIIRATPVRVVGKWGREFRHDQSVDDSGFGKSRTFNVLWRSGGRMGVGNPSLRFAAYAVEVVVDYEAPGSTFELHAAIAADAEAITDGLADARNWTQQGSSIRTIGGGGGAASMSYTLEQPLGANGWRLRIQIPVEVTVQ